VRYAWKKNTPALDAGAEAKLVKDGLLKPEEAYLQLRDAATGAAIMAHRNSCTAWNAHRKKWVNIVLQIFGSSMLGEVWYAEADSPQGPWVYATKIVTHGKYSFYNPKQHAFFSGKDSRHLYFEGTYTHTFSGNEHRTPRYDYNQVMYRLDLDDPRLALPAAVYDAKGADRGDYRAIRFFALDRPRAGAHPIKVPTSDSGETGDATFYVLPADTTDPGTTVPLFEYLSDGDAPPIYDVRGDQEIASYRRCPEPIGRVWPSPYRIPETKR
jgi:hypothetical protein